MDCSNGFPSMRPVLRNSDRESAALAGRLGAYKAGPALARWVNAAAALGVDLWGAGCGMAGSCCCCCCGSSCCRHCCTGTWQ